MTKIFKATQVIEREYEDAKLEFNINLPLGIAGAIPSIDLKYTCPNCSGYGCHGQYCDQRLSIEIKNLKKTIGDEQVGFLINYLENLISKLK